MASTEGKAELQPTSLSKEIVVPEWEHDATARDGQTAVPQHAGLGFRTFRDDFSRRFDALLPPHKRYLRMSRRVFLLVVLGVFLALLALIIGLAVGLSKHNQQSSSQNLPLPSNAQTFTGDLTYYGTGLGACGIVSSDSDNIVAVSHLLFDAAGSTSSNGGNSNQNPLCGLKLRASRFDTQVGAQRSVDLTVVDRCTGCQATDLDTSITAFEQMAAKDQGRVDVTWAWLQPAPTG